MKLLVFSLGCSLLVLAPAIHAQEAAPAPFVPLHKRPLLQIPAPSIWEKEIVAFETADKASFPAPGATLFIGSSSIRGWRTLAEDFPAFPVLNRGFGGSRISDAVKFAPRIVWPYSPSRIVFYAGTNDLAAGKSVAETFENWRKFVAVVREKQPDVPITFLSVVPAPSRAKDAEKISQLNTLIKDWNAAQKNLAFVDVATPLLDADGKSRLELYKADRLHMTPAGYVIWRATLTPILAPQETPKP